MKVVLFCGGQGMRLREYSERIPKPLVPVGQRPLLWNLMKYYSYYGHNDFIICLGHGAHKIKEFFLHYDEWETNDFVFFGNGKPIELLRTDITNWRITFVDTGSDSNVGERLRRVREHLEDEEVFLANYADGLSDLPLDRYVDTFVASERTAAFITVPVPHTFHVVHADEAGEVTALEPVATSSVRINAGFFILRREIFDYMRPGEELVVEPFRRLIGEGRLLAYPYDGFWRAMDTFKDKLDLDRIAGNGEPPWEVWSAYGADAP
jgi:glucose-1-phosphate cytidylyltransferase